MTLAVTLVNMVLGLAYTGYGVLTAVELKRDWRTFGFSHFGTAWLFMAFTCGPHHLSHGLHLLEDGSGGVLDLVSVLVGLPVGLTWLWLRIEAFSARGRGDRFIPGTPAWLRPVPLLGAAYTVALTVACVDVVRSSRPAGPIARANLVLVVIYLAIAWFLLRTQLQHRRQMGGWSLSGLSLGTVFATCALMHLVWASYAVAGWYRADVHSAVIDALSIPAGTYFLWVVRKLYRNALKDWNDQLPPTEPVPMQAGVYVSTERRLR